MAADGGVLPLPMTRTGLPSRVRRLPVGAKQFLLGVLAALVLSFLLALETSSRAFVYVGF